MASAAFNTADGSVVVVVVGMVMMAVLPVVELACFELLLEHATSEDTNNRARPARGTRCNDIPFSRLQDRRTLDGVERRGPYGNLSTNRTFAAVRSARDAHEASGILGALGRVGWPR